MYWSMSYMGNSVQLSPSPVMSAKSPSVEFVNNHPLQPMAVAERDLHDEGSADPVYQAKARVLNQTLQEIGMGKYQVRFCPPSVIINNLMVYSR